MTTVLYDFDIFNRQPYGGISRYFIELMRNLPADQATAHLFAGLHINRMLPSTGAVTGLRIPSLPRTATLREYFNQACLRIACRKWRPDVFHKTLYCRQTPPKGARVVITIHDLASARFPHLVGGCDLQTPMKRYWAARADAILAVSETTRADAVEILGIPRERITVVPLGVLQPQPSVLQTAVRPHPRPYLLYVGTRYEYKNFRRMVQAYAGASRSNRAFDLVCYGGGAFSSHEKALLAGCGIADRVHQRSGDDSQLLHYYWHARALVLPSVYEGFGLPLLEAMSAGCPVLASDIPSSREVAGDAALYFSPTDTGSMTALFEAALFDDQGRTRQVQAGRERASQFSWTRCASQTADVYRALCPNKS